jgi:hypothetical protein
LTHPEGEVYYFDHSDYDNSPRNFSMFSALKEWVLENDYSRVHVEKTTKPLEYGSVQTFLDKYGDNVREEDLYVFLQDGIIFKGRTDLGERFPKTALFAPIWHFTGNYMGVEAIADGIQFFSDNTMRYDWPVTREFTENNAEDVVGNWSRWDGQGFPFNGPMYCHTFGPNWALRGKLLRKLGEREINLFNYTTSSTVHWKLREEITERLTSIASWWGIREFYPNSTYICSLMGSFLAHPQLNTYVPWMERINADQTWIKNWYSRSEGAKQECKSWQGGLFYH